MRIGRPDVRILMAGAPAVLFLGLGAASPIPASGSQPEGRWLRPEPGPNATPVWGLKDGISIGLAPTRGPRGLFRIYTPYLGQQYPQMVNFISVEPVANGTRGQSELETGKVSGRRGLEMYAADTPEAALQRPAEVPSGRLERRDGTEMLTFYVATEPFRNGAHPIIQVTIRADRPREIGFRLYAAPDSAHMRSCVLSATMGNYGRLRHLWLNGEVVDSRKLWPEFKPDPLGFAPWRQWPRERLLRRYGNRIVAATSDEADPENAAYDPDVPRNWHYRGKAATQYWRVPDLPGTVTRVNGRITYWATQAHLPGGIAYENFEVEAPFSRGQQFWFGVTPDPPKKLGFDTRWGRNVTDGS